MFPHPADSRWWLSGQVNLIGQGHGRFDSPYQGANSFRPNPEQALSRLWTVYTGVKLPGHVELLVDVESAGGRGLSDALGLAGFTNLDVVRNPTLGAKPYLARLMVHATFALSDEATDAIPNPLALASRVPIRRIEVRVGKLGMADFFDVNVAGSDSHLQFTNWTIDNNGAYDYAADTRGYTVAAMVEYDAPQWSLRFAEALMPAVANGIDLDWNVARSRAENLELEWHPDPALSLKLLGYANHANMGSYDEAIQGFLSGRDSVPDVVTYREPGRVKTGVGANVEYTRQERSSACLRGPAGTKGTTSRLPILKRTTRSRLAAISSERSGADRAIGSVSPSCQADCRTAIASISPSVGWDFCSATALCATAARTSSKRITPRTSSDGISASLGAQYIDHPGYNRDRGPVGIGMLRLHVDF